MTQTNDGGATDLTTDALKRLAKAITPGPWNWQVNRQSRNVELSGGRQTKAGGDLTVMSFARWGLQGAAPVFWTWTGNIAEEVQRADEIAVPEPGREHHAGWFARIDHPDAELIALAPALLREVIDRREAVPVAGNLFIDSDGDLCIAGRDKNLVACLATDDADGDWKPLNPDVFPEIVRRWTTHPPQPSVSVAEAALKEARANMQHIKERLVGEWPRNGTLELIETHQRKIDAALRALKGSNE